MAIVDQLLDAASDLARDAGRAVAFGIAVPGLVRESTGTVVTATNLGWSDVPLRELASSRREAPLAISHDVRAAAVAEGLLGAARSADDYLLITLGTGIGAAAVIGGVPYTGSHGLGGELGHVTIDPRGPVCGCGNRGCLEALASAHHVASRYRAIAGDAATDEEVDAREVARRTAAGDPHAGAVWREALEALSIGIAGYVTLLDPELVVIGGGMAAAGGALFDPLRELLHTRLRLQAPPPVVAAELGSDAGRWGAAILAWRAAGIDEQELLAWNVRDGTV
jgi:glucokinase